ncbi:RsmB/NOP family class I SAM-dependent RNA methyltransferase [Amylibacter sp. SFDW26]|uniref:RsmB/NOP family class I SAM-dependent RNA methyltransferase n=1 Tax=Amylibacter sp. SFDW26 TaxID=2652722 RepID=UPI001262ABAB|nr:RsmB/NOP family class I SAM-dependent RNA methyltransferase [Amylibacter sp. SFDW26]KAB7615647.1 RsmB/NOP family class I SAM-dependent RNA methyltransferase [Amylibacter sp. SFDW26]
MTPSARYAAAIDILDRIFDGAPAEKVLTNWARSNRYAGSKDRAAVRDIVFDCLRCKRTFMFRAGFETGRGCVMGHILAQGAQIEDFFTGEKFAPAVLSDVEFTVLQEHKGCPEFAIQLDIPNWIAPKLDAALEDDDLVPALSSLQSRGSLDLRVNTCKTTITSAQASLAKEGVETEVLELSSSALRVLTNPRRVALSEAYQNGLVEIQDVGSQMIVDALPLDTVQTVLDYCAGGGGKSLAIAARSGGSKKLYAYDQSQARMNDLPARSKRAGAQVNVLTNDPAKQKMQYDLVLLDVPCSGTGAWRRNPDGKWRFTKRDLEDLCIVQQDILRSTQNLVSTQGYLAYVTCSLLLEENENQIETFLKENPEWISLKRMRLSPSRGMDGFFLEVLQKIQL